MSRTFHHGAAGQCVQRHVAWERKQGTGHVFIRMRRVVGRLVMASRFKLRNVAQTVQV